MPRLRVLSGDEVVKILSQFGFSVVGQKGSHVKLGRATNAGEHQTFTIPKHQELDRGTLQAIYRQASRYMSADDLRPYFYR